MIGSYYGAEPLLAIDGLGGSRAEARGGGSPAGARGPGTDFAIETMRGILEAHRRAPLGIFAEWAKQVGDVDWQDSETGQDYVIYPLTQAELTLANRDAFGHEVPCVAIMTRAPRRPGVVEEAFDDCPYEHLETDAVYSEADRQPMPQAYFLYWAKLREGVDGGRVSLDAVARRLGGRLVFPMEIPRRRGRARPMGRFQDALRMQLTIASQPDLGSIIAVSGTDDTGFPWAAAGIAGVAVWLFWRTVRG